MSRSTKSSRKAKSMPKKGTPAQVKKGRRGPSITTPEKSEISREYQRWGGSGKRGAASSTVRSFKGRFKLKPSQVILFDVQVSKGESRRKKIPGRPSKFNEEIEGEIDKAIAKCDTKTWREVAEEVKLPRSTTHRYGTQSDDPYRCLTQNTRPAATEAQKQKRVQVSQVPLARPK